MADDKDYGPYKGAIVLFPTAYGYAVIPDLEDPEIVSTIMAPHKIKCSECGTPVLELVSGSIIIRSKHHSKRHITALPISSLKKLSDKFNFLNGASGNVQNSSIQ
jgi:hypothetical protein